MIDTNFAFLAATYVFATDKPIARTLKAEDAFYASHGDSWIEPIARFFTNALAASPRVTIVPSSVKLA